MGTAAGGSAGALRSSSAGVAAINRAVTGAASEQSLARESLKVQKEQLKKLDQIARERAEQITSLPVYQIGA
jgi:hypothetical protein